MSISDCFATTAVIWGLLIRLKKKKKKEKKSCWHIKELSKIIPDALKLWLRWLSNKLRSPCPSREWCFSRDQMASKSHLIKYFLFFFFPFQLTFQCWGNSGILIQYKPTCYISLPTDVCSKGINSAKFTLMDYLMGLW